MGGSKLKTLHFSWFFLEVYCFSCKMALGDVRCVACIVFGVQTKHNFEAIRNLIVDVGSLGSVREDSFLEQIPGRRCEDVFRRSALGKTVGRTIARAAVFEC